MLTLTACMHEKNPPEGGRRKVPQGFVNFSRWCTRPAQCFSASRGLSGQR
jgi:hypothetical protein